MSLFKKAEETKVAGKVLSFGASGSGKSTFGLTFPKVVAVDTEDGLTHYTKNPNLEYILTTTSASEVEEAILEVEEELVGKVDTFVLDSETKVYENQQHGALNIVEKRASRKGQSIDDANLSQREWGKIKMIAKRIKAGQIRLASKGVHVVSIAQEKEVKEKKGENWVTVGYKPDAVKNIEYDFDIVLRHFTKTDKKTGVVSYFAEVYKDRTGIYKKGDIIENPSYENWASYFEGKQTKTENVKDFSKDIAKDEDGMKTDGERADEVRAEFTKLFKGLSDENKKKVKTLLSSQGVDPTSNDDIDKLGKIVAKMREL